MSHRRFIPTCVGRTLSSTITSDTITVHPHVRGADSVIMGLVYSVIGSSPRAWGGLEASLPPSLLRRFIPTCVGRTVFSVKPKKPNAVHPHVRGADPEATRGVAGNHGSSPRAWGGRQPPPALRCLYRFIPTCVGRTVQTDKQSILLSWFIPTCVGRTLSAARRPGSTSVHPHVRGADEGGEEVAGQLERFIPTCVGRTSYSGPEDQQ